MVEAYIKKKSFFSLHKSKAKIILFKNFQSEGPKFPSLNLILLSCLFYSFYFVFAGNDEWKREC